MKKISFLATLLLLMGLSLASCKEDTQPRVERPTEFVLNTPVMANLPYILTADNGIDIAVSQANYGIGLVPVYYVQISDTEDFAKFEQLNMNSTQARMTLSGEVLSQSINALDGVEEESQFSPRSHTIFMRVLSTIPNWEEGNIYSNVIKLNSVTPYFTVHLPAVMYLVGQPNGWNINESTFILSEPDNGIGSKIYYGTFDISAADAASGFRFYETLGSWGDDGELPSIGSNAKDGDNATVALDENNQYSGKCVFGKGNWSISNWPGGLMKITVDLNKMSVIFEKG